jgi:translation elongation factor EF-Tu-like GTPase
VAATQVTEKELQLCEAVVTSFSKHSKNGVDMDWRKDAEAEITFIPTEAGGRRSPARSGYRPILFVDGENWDAIQAFPDNEHASPGDTVRAFLSFTFPAELAAKLPVGKVFLVREGNRFVAYGKITKLFALSSAQEHPQVAVG